MESLVAARPTRPENEEARLKALRQIGILDTAPEEDFDSLVRLASVICETPISTVTLIDRERQWHKAMIGLTDTEAPRDIAFCAHTIMNSELMVVADTLSDPRFAENPLVTGDPSIRFYAGVPLEVEEGLRVGTLCVIDRSPRQLSPAQREALHLLAQQATKQIKARRQQQELRSTIAQSNMVEQELRSNQGLFHAFMDNSPFVAFMKDASGRMVYYNQRCAEHFQIDRAAWLGKSEDDLWPPEAAARQRANDLAVLRQWQTLIVEEQSRSAADKTREWRSYRFPFRDSEGNEYVAGFMVDITLDKEAERQIRSYQQALEQANGKLATLASTDGLTKLHNRRSFDAALLREAEVAKRHGHPLTLMILDIDDFKRVNDTFGHEEGDRVLRRVAGIMEETFRGGDLVARFGGEEFAVLLPNTEQPSATETAERLRLAVARSEAKPSVTISIGLAVLEAPTWSQADLLKRADDCLYKAKREGKNRVCVC